MGNFELVVTLTLHNKSKTMAAPRLNSVLLRSAISGKWHTGSSKYFCSSYGRQAYPQLTTVQKFQTNLTSPCIKVPMFSNQKSNTAILNICQRLASTSKADVESRVLAVCKTFDNITTATLTMESHFINDLGLDSLDHVEVIMAIEDEFGFEIPDDHAEKLLTPMKIVEYVSEHENIVA